jgi:predicted AlkP superfamily pyrophosphatase or phosphodiesterase
MVERLTIRDVCFETIPVKELRYNFSLIENDLFSIKAKSICDWSIADIYTSLKDGDSQLHLMYKEDEYVGFLVTQLLENDLSKERTLHVWATFAKSEYNCRQEGFDFLDVLAENKEANLIEFSTSRTGWEKIGPMFGFDLVSYLYRKEV